MRASNFDWEFYGSRQWTNKFGVRVLLLGASGLIVKGILE